jgi:hypothetical protein
MEAQESQLFLKSTKLVHVISKPKAPDFAKHCFLPRRRAKRLAPFVACAEAGKAETGPHPLLTQALLFSVTAWLDY